MVVARNSALSAFLSPSVDIDRLRVYAFFPPALRGSLRRVRIVDALKSGGRTFLLGHRSASALGLPPTLYLELSRLGWGSGRLELRPEVKGAGTDFFRSKIDTSRLRDVLRRHPALRQTIPSPLEIFSSLAVFEDRNVGGQELTFGQHSVNVSTTMLGISEIKFAPAWVCVRQPAGVAKNLAIVSAAIPPHEPLFDKPTVSEIRFTPGTVRAVYFDHAESDEQLVGLCHRVSDSVDEVEEALDNMIMDARRYLDLLGSSTAREVNGHFSWTKIGDISLEFRRDQYGLPRRAHEYKNVMRNAWYLAKDEVVVRCIGKVFTDMESFRAAPSRYRATSPTELWFQHELFVLNVLRDHLRVCTQLSVAVQLARGKRVGYSMRCGLQKRVIRLLLAAINSSSLVGFELGARIGTLTVRYPQLDGIVRRFHFLRGQIGERYL
jgi:hypothetical protein